ncbi:predicted protein [Chaetoceros tenuissimus]|uniref:Uncharacterized protein n=1 Tax=Chaetoceros tenuissimus TaxID=426638 RepID=A0AAD3CXD7_9STRA|nr:predicted protein [Chaetoceros tenuissimus]
MTQGWCFEKRLNSYRTTKTVSRLKSTLFDDDELDWDAEDDDDEFDIQINSIFDKKQKDQSKQIMDDSQSLQKVEFDDIEDDTDDSYYEQLFLQQNMSPNLSQEDKDEEIQREKDDKLKQEKEEEEKRQQQMILFEQEWRERVHQMRNDIVQTRKLKRLEYKRSQLEERASLLALRALREQSVALQDFNRVDTTNESNSHEKIRKKLKNQKLVHPTLSLASMRNYKRRDDVDLSENELRLEQKLYGRRFKSAQSVYIRLLEALEDMRIESTRVASDMIADRVEEEAYIALASSDKSKSTVMSSKSFVEQVTKMNQFQKQRMKTVVQLSLNGIDDGNQDLAQVETEILLMILRVRGNVKKRGRYPKTRSKILEHLKESFFKPLF